MGFVPSFKDDSVNIDYSSCTPVAVIPTFAPSGKFKPLYFLVVDEYGNDCKVKITGIKDTKEEKSYTSFFCTYQVGSRQRECKLTYYMMEHLWVLEH